MAKATILCVDDTQSNIDVLIELLKDYDLIVSLDAMNAFEMLQRTPVDLILLDVMMPGVDGFELCRLIKSDAALSEIPVLFLTAKADEASIEKGYELGAVDYVTKPFKPKELIARVKTHLQLHTLVQNLNAQVESALEQQRHHEHLLVTQSYAASMGEMIDIVAHQWMQPLNNISMRLSKLMFDYEDEMVDEMYLKTFQERSLTQIRHLSATLNEFRSFMSPNKAIETFSLKAMIDKALLLLKDELMASNVHVAFFGEEDFEIKAIENEFIHVIINLIRNAKEAFELREQNEAQQIDLMIDPKHRSLHVQDNAGGVDPKYLDTLFDLHVSSKKTSGGTGLGLYMSNMIVTKYGGNITVINSDKGARFSITF